jgi:hypothetical protein
MAKAKGKRKSPVRNLKPRGVRTSDSRHIKGGFSKINPVDGSTGGGSINDKIN